MSIEVKPTELDLDKSQIELKQKQTNLTQAYENKIKSLFQDKLDNTITQEDYEDVLDEIRREFLTKITEINRNFDISTPEVHFRHLMSKAIMDQIRRGFGYYEALIEVKPLINQYNNQLGEDLLHNTTKPTFEAIEKIEKIKLIHTIVTAMELPQQYTDRIVNLVIDKEFGYRKIDR
jgi:hypothetical protein